MPFVPNIGPATRLLYVVAGVALVVASFTVDLRSPAVPPVVALLGVISVLEGVAGF